MNSSAADTSGDQGARRARAVDRLAGHLRVPLFRTAYALILSNVLTSVLGLVYWVVGARLYSPDAVGVNAALISTMTFLSGVSQLNLRTALNRFIPEAGSGVGKLISVAYAITIPISVAVVAIFVLTVELWAPDSPVAVVSKDFVLLGWFMVATASWGIFNMQDGVLTGLQRPLVIPFENLIFAVAKLILLVLLAGFASQYGIFTSWSVPQLIAVLLVTFWILRHAVPRAVAASGGKMPQLAPRDIVRFVATDYFAALLVLAYVSLLPVLVISAVGSQTGAYFYIVWTIATSLNLVPLSLSISQTVESVAVGGDPFVQARAVLAHLVKVIGPVVVLIVIGAPWLLAVFGPGYAEAGTDLLRLMALGVVPYGVNVVYFGLARVRRQLRGVVLSQAFLAVATPAIALTLLPHVGLTGVGIAWLTSQAIVSGIVLATALRPAIVGTPQPR